MTWPSFFAASIRAGVTGSAAGADAMTRVENAAPASKAPDPLSTVRREMFGFIMGVSIRLFWRDRYPASYLLFLQPTPESFVDSLSSLPLNLTTGLSRQTWPRTTQKKRETEMTGPRFALA